MRSFQMKKMYLLSITLISLGILAGCSNNDSTKVQKLETTISSLKKENDSFYSGSRSGGGRRVLGAWGTGGKKGGRFGRGNRKGR